MQGIALRGHVLQALKWARRPYKHPRFVPSSFSPPFPALVFLHLEIPFFPSVYGRIERRDRQMDECDQEGCQREAVRPAEQSSRRAAKQRLLVRRGQFALRGRGHQGHQLAPGTGRGLVRWRRWGRRSGLWNYWDGATTTPGPPCPPRPGRGIWDRDRGESRGGARVWSGWAGSATARKTAATGTRGRRSSESWADTRGWVRGGAGYATSVQAAASPPSRVGTAPIPPSASPTQTRQIR